jgi:hypothetical protein
MKYPVRIGHLSLSQDFLIFSFNDLDHATILNPLHQYIFTIQCFSNRLGAKT